MNVMISTLLSILDEETSCYREMENLLADEEESISFSRKDRFDTVQLKKDALLFKLQQFEQKRKPMIDRLADGYGTGGQPLTISRLARYVAPPYDERLLERADRLRSVIGAVQEKNRRNQLLINHYLDLIKGSLNLLTRHLEDNPVYQKPGTRQPSAGYPCGGGRLICGTV
ncbi:hypothetical protein DSCA_07160 [Desulfosarcina alkanivorans]|jgi:flagellar biosynthesis/type III secretory pathway chaperone|uniref:Flagellar protein FlgN n=1 Tax=Desulfosarcina alkanivorans TaxID=571177 RepID=A0A5K7YCW6_9BACT|nr:flagellar protein FlgN [Desulfosarcina alkanivorans]BBO66786.1 hypothetical protein DSCA_07160 [Desulfosarcina alkanivorans]